MKTVFAPSSITKGLYIPPEISDNTSLKDAASIDVYGCGSAILLLDRNLPPWKLVEAVDMLSTVTNTLILRIEEAAKSFEDDCRQISVPQEALDKAGIPDGAPLDILADEGEIYITVFTEEDDPLEHLPGFLYELFDDSDLDHGALRLFLNSEEPVHE